MMIMINVNFTTGDVYVKFLQPQTPCGAEASK